MCSEGFLYVRIDIFLQRIRLGLENEQISQIRDQVRHQTHHVLAAFRLLVEELECAGRFTTQNLSGEIDHGLFARESEHVEDVILPDLFSAKATS
jgi:hypothetical protein